MRNGGPVASRGETSFYVVTKKGWKIAAKLTGSLYWPDEMLKAK